MTNSQSCDHHHEVMPTLLQKTHVPMYGAGALGNKRRKTNVQPW